MCFVCVFQPIVASLEPVPTPPFAPHSRTFLPPTLPMQFPSPPPPPGQRLHSWAWQPCDALRSGGLSDRGLGLLPTSYTSSVSCDWKLVIGQAHGPGIPLRNTLQEAEAFAAALEAALLAQWSLADATDGLARLQHKPGSPNFALAIRLKGSEHPAANGLLQQLRTARHLHVSMPMGVVCVPAVDHGASDSLQSVRLLVLGLDPLAHREGITGMLLRCAGYTVSMSPGPGCVRVVSEQAGAPRLGGKADITTVVSFVIPPPDDPYLHRLPPSFVDNTDNITHVLVHGDPLAPPHGARAPAREPHPQAASPPYLWPNASPPTGSGSCPPGSDPTAPAMLRPVQGPAVNPTATMRAALALPPQAPPMLACDPIAPASTAPAAPHAAFLVVGPAALAPHSASVASPPAHARPLCAPPPPPSPVCRSLDVAAASSCQTPPLQTALEFHGRFVRPAASVAAQPTPPLELVAQLTAADDMDEDRLSVDSGRLSVDVDRLSVDEDRLLVDEDMPDGPPGVADDALLLPLPPLAPPTAPAGGDPAVNPFPVSDGSAHRDEGTGCSSGSEDADTPDPPPGKGSRPHPADFGDGRGYSLGRPAALQAARFAAGPSAMSGMEDNTGRAIVPPHHAPVLSPQGDTAFVPVHQLASMPSAQAKSNSRDRSGIGASPDWDSWEVKAAVTRFIASTYGDHLQPPGMPSALDCALAVLNRSKAWWSHRRAQMVVDAAMARRIDDYMRSLTGIVRGPRPVLLHVRSIQAAARSPQARRPASEASVRAPSPDERRREPEPVKNPAPPAPRSRVPHCSAASSLGGGGRVAP